MATQPDHIPACDCDETASAIERIDAETDRLIEKLTAPTCGAREPGHAARCKEDLGHRGWHRSAFGTAWENPRDPARLLEWAAGVADSLDLAPDVNAAWLLWVRAKAERSTVQYRVLELLTFDRWQGLCRTFVAKHARKCGCGMFASRSCLSCDTAQCSACHGESAVCAECVDELRLSHDKRRSA